ncbi:helix-turn-helix domain-containing protein [Flaviflexus equikiangi]|uniref:Helix-turn-helix transcriptional regulator n=1 Tax=Flaviflexus equikiangi TaxID=2758573 RepID=A0ABS2TF80_9ACTO|nr:helix-turn-helix transcriptional regulator [Flaviflexus equikiangi]MBM9433311.1 helix-turn-helix transcriptional regulator [Flaviflexus equikiangi]
MKNSSVPDNVYVQALGQVCIRHRKDRGFSQQAFALEIGVDTSNYQCIESGHNSRGEMTNPQTKTLLAISRGFGISIADLMSEAWDLALTMN